MSEIDKNAVKTRFAARRPTVFDDQMAEDSVARRCFVNQGFSQKLQKFMIDYSLRVQSPLAHTIGTK